jgi:hypothetical protein
MYIIANGIGIVLLIILLTIAIIVKIVSGEVNKRCQYSSKKNFLDEGEALNVEENTDIPYPYTQVKMKHILNQIGMEHRYCNKQRKSR